MNRALRPTTDEERAEQIAHDKIILFREGWPDMHQMPEDEPTNWNPIAIVLFTWAAILAVVIGWIAFERIW